MACTLTPDQDYRNIHTPSGAADPLAWYIWKIECAIDHFPPYNLVHVMEHAGIGSVPLELLKAYTELDGLTEAAQESAWRLLTQLRALQFDPNVERRVRAV